MNDEARVDAWEAAERAAWNARFPRLEAACLALSQDAGIRLAEAPGVSWAWAPDTRTILIPSEEMMGRPLESCLGFVAHEVGHALVTRAVPLPGGPAERLLARWVHNVLEDGRVERYVQARHPGTARWFARLSTTVGAVPVDVGATVAFVVGMLAAHRHGEGVGLAGIPAAAREALEATRDARRRFALSLPGCDDAVWRATGRARTPTEAEVVEAAEASARILFDEILPHVDACVRADAGMFVGASTTDPAISGTLGELGRGERARFTSALALLRRVSAVGAKPGRASDAVLAQVRWLVAHAVQETLFDVDAVSIHCVIGEDGADHWPSCEEDRGASLLSSPRTADPDRMRRRNASRRDEAKQSLSQDASTRATERAMSRWLEEAARAREDAAQRGAEVDVAGAGDSRPEALLSDEATGLALVSKWRREVEALSGALAPWVGGGEARRRVVRGPSGWRADLRRVAAHEAEPERAGDVWLRPAPVRRRSVAALVLVDLSASMGATIEAGAVPATLVVHRALRALGVPTCVVGHQSRLLPFVGFEAPADLRAARAIASMTAEARLTRPGADDPFNDDGPCLLAAWGLLRERPEKERWLIAISDGQPAGRRSGAPELHAAIASLWGDPSGPVLVGLGVGPETDAVASFHPHAAAPIGMSGFAERVASVLSAARLDRPPP